MLSFHKMEHKLLIVDIQKMYSHCYNINYLMKVKRFLTNSGFKDIRMLIDLSEENYSGESIPSFIDNYLTGAPIFKQYSSDLVLKLLELEKLDISETKQKLLDMNCLMPFLNGWLVLLEPRFIPDYKFCHDNIIDHYYLEYIPPSFKDYLDSCLDSKIHLIGGGFCECVNVTKKILDLLHIPNCIHAKYCYEINGYSSLSYTPLESKIEMINRNYCDIVDDQTHTINWSFKRNSDFFCQRRDKH